MARMSTVRQEIFRIAHEREIDLLFGNPGSTELSLLAGSQPHLRYIHCLHEAVAVAAAAGYSAISGHPSLVNLHTVAGLSNAMGAISTAAANRAPIVITAGQQDTRHLRYEPLLSGPLTEIARPLTKWSHEPVRAADVPLALERAFRIALAPPRGPVFLSIPMDFLELEGDPAEVRDPVYGRALDEPSIAHVVDALASARRPAMVTGAGVETADAWDPLVEFAEELSVEVYAAPVASQFGFPTGHPLYRHQLGVAASQIAKTLVEHDVVVVVGAPVFLLYPYTPDSFLPDGCRLILLTEDAREASRLAQGEAYVGGLRSSLSSMAAYARSHAGGRPGRSSIAVTEPSRAPEAGGHTGPVGVRDLCRSLARWKEPDTVFIDESVSSGGIARQELKVMAPRTYLRSANGGLGTAMPAGLGAQLARPDGRVMVLTGDGSAMYSIQSLWTAAQEHLPVKFVIINNRRYKILQDFHERYHAHLGDAPGLTLPGLDFGELARGMGVQATTVTDIETLDRDIDAAFSTDEPHLLDVQLGDAVTESFFT